MSTATPLSDSTKYKDALATLQGQIKAMARADGGAIEATTSWTVNGSQSEGRRMVRDFSKLMLRAYNAEADNLVVRGMKPYKLDSAKDRLEKVAFTIAKLGKSMQIPVSPGLPPTAYPGVGAHGWTFARCSRERRTRNATVT